MAGQVGRINSMTVPGVTNGKVDTQLDIVELTDNQEKFLGAISFAEIVAAEDQFSENRIQGMPINYIQAILRLNGYGQDQFSSDELQVIASDVSEIHRAVLGISNVDTQGKHSFVPLTVDLKEKLSDRDNLRKAITAYRTFLNFMSSFAQETDVISLSPNMTNDNRYFSFGVQGVDNSIDFRGGIGLLNINELLPRLLQMSDSATTIPGTLGESGSAQEGGKGKGPNAILMLLLVISIAATAIYGSSNLIKKMFSGGTSSGSGENPSALIVPATEVIPTAHIDPHTPVPETIPTSEFTFVDPNVQLAFEQAGVTLENINNIENSTYTNEGLTVTGRDGTVYKISKEELGSRLFYDQGYLKIKSEDGSRVELSYDPDTNTFLEYKDYMSWPIVSAEACIQANGWEEMEANWKYEYMFMLPFNKDNTYFPKSEEIYWDWSDRFPVADTTGLTPLGQLPPGMEAPMRFVNCMVVNRGAGSPEMVVTMQVFNKDDGSWSLLHFTGRPGGGSIVVEPEREIAEYIKSTQSNIYYLPSENFINSISKPFNEHPWMAGYRNYMQYKGLKLSDGRILAINQLVEEWLRTGHVPKELEGYYLHGDRCFWEY